MGKVPQEILEAWRAAYQIYAKYSQPLKEAAREGRTDEAGRLFAATMEETRWIFLIGGDAKALSFHVYGLLEDIYKENTPQDAQS